MTSEVSHWRNIRKISFDSFSRFSQFLPHSFLKLIILAFIFSLFYASPVLANNLSISNISIVDDDTTAKTAVIEFDISWSNAWRDSVNYDAAWVFFKWGIYSSTSTDWAHITMRTSGRNPSGFSTGTKSSTSTFSTLELIVPEDKMGVFIQPGHSDNGTLSFTDVQVVWDYGADGLSTLTTQSLTVTAIGIEMVYIPEGGFVVGDGTFFPAGDIGYGASGVGGLGVGTISSEEAMSFGWGANPKWYYRSDYGTTDATNDGTIFEVSESFPKGYHAFYLMKTEITQEQYMDFLNMQSRNQQQNLISTSMSGLSSTTNIYVMTNTSVLTNRNTITCASSMGSGDQIDFTVSRATRAMNYLLWKWFAAYADWAALRPMTELEFEKAARGPLYPNVNESVTGTSVIPMVVCTALNSESTDAGTCTTTSANVANRTVAYGGTGDGGSGPLRAGIFATSQTNRHTAGAGYYGNLDLSGNVSEWVVTLGLAAGRSFHGSHGDGTIGNGTIGYFGRATVTDWPTLDSTDSSLGVSDSLGSGIRGGSWMSSSSELRPSARLYAATSTLNSVTSAAAEYGGRCARTAPDNT